MTVLHVTGSGRSGSTLLAATLGSVPGVFAAGEVRYLWERGVIENRRCGCREPAHSCPVWSKVFARLGPIGTPEEADAMRRSIEDATRLRRSMASFLGGPQLRDGEATLAEHLGDVYRAIADTTGATMIVDSSKLPPYAALLEQVPGIELRVLHLVRDPRAAAWSWTKGRAGSAVAGFDEPMGRLSPAKSSLLWTIWNGLTLARWRRRGGRYLLVRYEDVMRSPRAALTSIAEFAGIDPTELPIVDDEHVDIASGHVLAGNPNRMREGATALRTDLRWQREMPSRDRLVVSAITAPLRWRFGYPWRTT